MFEYVYDVNVQQIFNAVDFNNLEQTCYGCDINKLFHKVLK